MLVPTSAYTIGVAERWNIQLPGLHQALKVSAYVVLDALLKEGSLHHVVSPGHEM